MHPPQSADSFFQSGNERLAQNDFAGAIAAYEQALRIDPQLFEALYNCGVAFHQQSQYEHAVERYAQVVRLRPELAEAHFNMAHALADLNRLEESEAAYRTVLRLQPDNAQAAYNLGLLYKSQGLYDQAVATFQRSLKIRPDYAEALNNIGVIWRDQDKLDQAKLYFEQALQIKPDMVEAFFNIGIIHQKKGAFDHALESYRKALALNPNYAPARWLYLLAIPMYYELETQIEHYRQLFTENLETLIRATRLETEQGRRAALQGLSVTANFYLQYQGRDDLYLQQFYGRFATRIMAANFPHWSQPKPMPVLNSGEKIRIGYASSCLYGHTIGIFLKGWLTGANRDDFEYYCYHIGDRKDALTESIRQGVDHFYHFPGNVTAAAAQIENDRLHILIHTDIGMNPATLQLAALRLAPVQCKGWGHPVTTGLPTIDYYLSSDLMETADAQQYYSEKLIRLPNLALNLPPPLVPASPKTRKQFGIPEAATVFLTTQSLFKYLPQHDDIYPQIAAQVPRAMFVFLAHNNESVTSKFAGRLSSAFEKQGLSFRCLFVPRLNHEDFLNLNLAADVLLDSLEWSGGKSSLEALACDLPIVTLPGALMRGRHTYAFLKRMGLEATIAGSKADYIQLAVRLANEPGFHAAVKDHIRANKHLLFNDVTVVRALEDFYRRFARGKTPDVQEGSQSH
ncbi:MAG: tetratricopeptide repeat protein [Desulfobacteraceae bacterium]|nr:tetratricopeptide repeat protein [Desulfobacteraceae bacterium]